MKARALIALALTSLLVAVVIAPSTAAAKAPKATVVGTDPDGDWGSANDPAIAPIGDALGQDLIGAAISGDSKTVNFIITVNSLPPIGGAPEVSRYIWDLNVDGEFVELDGKFTNYSRGVCDPTSGQCPPPRNPGMQPFLVRGNCTVVEGSQVTTCEEMGIVQASFDAAAGTITIPVPGEMIGAKKGSKITPAANLFGGTIAAAPSAFLTSAASPMDTLAVTKTFVVKK